MNDLSEISGASVDSEGKFIPLRKRIYTAGTLRYTFAGLLMMFFWVLWGDFAFTIMEQIFPVIVPLMMNKLNASSTLIGLFCTTIPSLLNFIITPWVSFKSDRHRSKWGRRIPFLLFPTPFLTLFLILIGYSDVIGPYLHRTMFAGFGWSQTTVTLTFLAVMVVAFKYFDMFVASVYYYLFNDVVPKEFLSRFLSLFRIVGTIGGMCFNLWMLPKVETHQHEIFVITGLLYLVVFSLMCLNIKEGEYPPPPQNLDGREGVLSSIKTYFVECFSHRFYWWCFSAMTLYSLSGSVNIFRILYQQKSLGLSLAQLGIIGVWAGIIGVVLGYPAGMYSDKKHPIRSVIIALAGLIIVTPLQLIFLFRDFSPSTTYYIILATTMLTLPITTLYTMAAFPLTMRLFPPERYGQFCAAQAMLGALGIMVGGVLAGAFMDIMKRMTGGGTYFYRYVPCWSWFFLIASFLCMLVVFKYWKAYGGDKNYQPPEVGCVVE